MKQIRIDQKKLDKIEVSFVSQFYESLDTEQFTPCLKINGNTTFQDIDTKELVESTRATGHFWLFVCTRYGCGQPECGGFYDQATVLHDSSDLTVTWILRRPLQRELNKNGHWWLPASGYDVYVFDRREYLESISAALEEGKRLVAASKHEANIIGYAMENFMKAESVKWEPPPPLG